VIVNRDIPMKYISPAAEEMLAYGNTVPEWLCPSRQEKLYAGEPLFGYVELVREEQLCGFKALHSVDLQ
jgi:integrator complex subunit 9